MSDTTTVLAALASAAMGGLALLRSRSKHRHDAYQDARTDLDECKARGARLEERADALEVDVAGCNAKHEAAARLAVDLGDQLRRADARVELLAGRLEELERRSHRPPGGT